MDNWIVIRTFDRIQQAQFRKALLEQNNIEAEVFVKKDSAFLLGNIDLLVRTNHRQKALQILNEFNGWTQIGYFNRNKPLEILEEILRQKEIETMLTSNFDPVINSSVYELYIQNQMATEVLDWLSLHSGWQKLCVTSEMKFAGYYVDILEKYKIDAIVHYSAVNEVSDLEFSIFAPNVSFDFASNLLAELRGWTVVLSPNSKDDAQKWVDFLEENAIPAIFEQELENKIYYLYTQLEFEQEATNLINHNRNWVLCKSFSDFYQAILAKNILSQQGVEAIIMTKKDSTFLIGDIELYTEESKLSFAQQILEEIIHTESNNEE